MGKFKLLQNLVLLLLVDLCSSINDEGSAPLRFRERVELDPYGALMDWDGGALDPCLWLGVECFDGKVGSFFLEGNKFIGSVPPEWEDLTVLSEKPVHEDCSERLRLARVGPDKTIRRLLQVGGEDRVWHQKNGKNIANKPLASKATILSPSPVAMDMGLAPSESPLLLPFHPPVVSPSSVVSVPSSAPSPSISFPSPVPSPSPTPEPPSPVVEPKLNTKSPAPPAVIPAYTPLSVSAETPKERIKSWKIYMPITIGVSFLLAMSVIYLYCCRTNRVVTVRPWATGLSGQLQKAFVTGVPALKRSELEMACEDFSNIIDSLSDCKLYKGTLSSGVEIAVVSTLVTSAKNWSKHSESQFRKKISVLSKLNHKNFVNLLGYCAEQEPFTRMMVFEYAPNGSLFEHLHVKEAEVLDWGARLRIAMGVAYCLDYMDQSDPPVILRELDSSTVFITDDYAAKVGDIKFWNETKESSSPTPEHDMLTVCREGVVYKFGVLLLEILSGRLSCNVDSSLSVKELIDPALGDCREEEIEALLEVIRSCINPDPDSRPKMSQVVAKLKDITSLTPDRATPKVSPLWWAEIEILSSEAN